MVRARPNVREPEGHVYRIVKLERFDRRQSLIVIRCHNNIKLALMLPMEDRISGKTTGEPGHLGPQPIKLRIEHFGFLRTK